MVLILLKKKNDIKWQRSLFPTLNLNLQPIGDVQPEIDSFDIINSQITYFSKYYCDADYELMVKHTNIYALQKG